MTVADAPRRFCGACGGSHAAEARFCGRCGAPVGGARAQPDAARASQEAAVSRPPEIAVMTAPEVVPPTVQAASEDAPLFAARAPRPARQGPSTTWVAAAVTAVLLAGGGIWWAVTGGPEWYRHPMDTPSSVVAPPPVALTPRDAPLGPVGYADPATYCQVVGTIDEPDKRYTGRPIPEVVSGAVGVNGGAVWRCGEGRILACARGDDRMRCAKFDLAATPSAAVAAYCGQNPDAAEVDPEVAPWNSVYAWGCYQGAPVARRQIRFPDTEGYDAADWVTAP